MASGLVCRLSVGRLLGALVSGSVVLASGCWCVWVRGSGGLVAWGSFGCCLVAGVLGLSVGVVLGRHGGPRGSSFVSRFGIRL